MTTLTPEQVQTINLGIKTAENIHDIIQRSVEGKSASINISTVVSISLFMRILDLFHGSLACIRIKKPINSYILIRTMTEALVLLRGATRDADFSKELHNKSVGQKKNRLVNLIKDLPLSGLTLSKEDVADLIKQTEADKVEEIKTAADTYSIFKRFGALNLYHQVFAHCSLHAHNDPQSLGEYMDTNESGALVLNYEKDLFKNSGLTLLMTMRNLLHAYEDICLFLDIDQIEKESLASAYNNFEQKFGSVLKSN